MPDFNTVSYVVLGLSVSVSVVQAGNWLLNADPRRIVAVGRWSLVGLGALAPFVLIWLAISGRAGLAMMFAAFILPVVVQSAHRWQGYFRRPPSWSNNPDRTAARAAAVLEAYLRQVAASDQRMSPDRAFAILGLGPGAGPGAVIAAHARLAERVDPERGGTRYLVDTVDAARDVLLALQHSDSR